MPTSLLDSLLDAPDLPELLQEAQRAWENEQKLRQKFYNDITEERKWEFIQGEVIMHSPALNRHLIASEHILYLLSAHVRVHDLDIVRHEKAMTTFPRNDYEPDVIFFGPTKTALIKGDTLRFPIPDLIVEVLSPSTEFRDRGIKFKDYALHGVAEYWIIDTVAETVELHRLSSNVYAPAERQADGLLTSDVVPGFEIPVRAIFDEKVNLKTLQAIMANL